MTQQKLTMLKLKRGEPVPSRHVPDGAKDRRRNDGRPAGKGRTAAEILQNALGLEKGQLLTKQHATTTKVAREPEEGDDDTPSLPDGYTLGGLVDAIEYLASRCNGAVCRAHVRKVPCDCQFDDCNCMSDLTMMRLSYAFSNVCKQQDAKHSRYIKLGCDMATYRVGIDHPSKIITLWNDRAREEEEDEHVRDAIDRKIARHVRAALSVDASLAFVLRCVSVAS